MEARTGGWRGAPSEEWEITEKRPCLVLGEGKDETRVFKCFLKTLGKDGVQRRDYGGKHRLGSFLDVLPNVTGFSHLRSLLVTRDADDDPEGAAKSIRGGLERAGLPVPDGPGQFTDGPLRVAFLVLPGDGREGMLEDLCMESLAEDSATDCVEEYFACVEKEGCSPKPRAKAWMGAWLASRERPALRLGEAMERGYLKADAPAFEPLLRLLREM